MSKQVIPHIDKSEIVYHGFFDMRVDHLALPHGPTRPYTVLMTGTEAAAILAETPDGELVLLKEYRHPTKQWLLGCAGGRLDGDEPPLVGAKRELLEETGYSSDELIPMGCVYPFPAVSDQKIHFILAKNAKWIKPTEHETFELIEVMVMSPEKLYQEIASGAPVDGVLCTALFLREHL